MFNLTSLTLLLIILFRNEISLATVSLIENVEGLNNCRSFIEDNIKEAWARSSPGPNGENINIEVRKGDILNFLSNNICSECGQYTIQREKSSYAKKIRVTKNKGAYTLTEIKGNLKAIQNKKQKDNIYNPFNNPGIDQVKTIEMINYNGHCFPKKVTILNKYSNREEDYSISTCARLNALNNNQKKKVKKCSNEVNKVELLIGITKREIPLLELLYQCKEYEKKYSINTVYGDILSKERSQRLNQPRQKARTLPE